MAQARYSDLNLPEYEQPIRCPYNSSHQIIAHRFQTHLIKCRRSYPRSDPFATCRFNHAHVYPAPEIAHHEKNCESSINVLRYLYADDAPNNARSTEVPAIADVACSSAENWDDDNCVAYDPKKYCNENAIITNIQHMTPSQRKAKRLNQRERIIQLNNRPQQ